MVRGRSPVVSREGKEVDGVINRETVRGGGDDRSLAAEGKRSGDALLAASSCLLAIESKRWASRSDFAHEHKGCWLFHPPFRPSLLGNRVHCLGVYMNSGAKRICTVQLYRNDYLGTEQPLPRKRFSPIGWLEGAPRGARGSRCRSSGRPGSNPAWSGKADSPSFSGQLGCSETADLPHRGRGGGGKEGGLFSLNLLRVKSQHRMPGRF